MHRVTRFLHLVKILLRESKISVLKWYSFSFLLVTSCPILLLPTKVLQLDLYPESF